MSSSHPPRLEMLHFRHLEAIGGEGCQWLAGKVPNHWAAQIGIAACTSQKLPSKRQSRDEVFEFCRLSDIELSTLAVLSWGGMKVTHGRLVTSPDIWPSVLKIVEGLRSAKLNRMQAYMQFAAFRADTQRTGLGPAYFTKLIYFLLDDASPKGFIMDQWTSLSINLLFQREGKPVVSLSSSVYHGRRTDTVSDRNTPNDYETFCQCIEQLAQALRLEDAAVAEEWIFSRGGVKPAPWRKYLLAHRPLLTTHGRHKH